jgi:hypothetical protein
MTPWTGDQTVAIPLPTQNITNTLNTHNTNIHAMSGIRTYIPSILLSEVHALDCAVTVTVSTANLHVSKIHGITSGMSSSYVDSTVRDSLYQHRAGNAKFSRCQVLFMTLSSSHYLTVTVPLRSLPARIPASTRRLIVTLARRLLSENLPQFNSGEFPHHPLETKHRRF